MLVQTPAGRFGSYVARNVSGGGLFLEAEDPFPEGCPIELFFALPQGDCGIAAKGKVHHCELHQRPGGGWPIPGMGIHFVWFDDDGRLRLRQSLSRELD